jgi:hypothetical protein
LSRNKISFWIRKIFIRLFSYCLTGNASTNVKMTLSYVGNFKVVIFHNNCFFFIGGAPAHNMSLLNFNLFAITCFWKTKVFVWCSKLFECGSRGVVDWKFSYIPPNFQYKNLGTIKNKMSNVNTILIINIIKVKK